MINSGLQGGDNNVIWPFVNTALRISKSAKNLIDVGSGVELSFEKKLIEENSNIQITCLDINFTGDSIDSKFPNIRRLEGNVYSEEFVNLGKFDIVCMFEILEHLEYPDIAIKNAKKLMNRNSALLISIPNLSSIFARINLLFGFQPHVLEASDCFPRSGMGLMGKLNYGESNQAIHHVRGYTYKAIVEVLISHNLDIIMIEGYSNLPFWPKNWFRSFSNQLFIAARLK